MKPLRASSSIREPLCCCEYDDVDGQRNHLLACCCNCEALDTVCDRCLTCKSVPDSTIDRMFAAIEDRCRVPRCCCGMGSSRGAVRISLDIFFPIVVIPSALLIATIGPIMTKLVLCSLPCFLVLFYWLWMKRGPGRPRTRLFYTWALTSALLMYTVYLSFVIAFREVLLWETMLLTSMFFTMLVGLYYTKQDPGVVAKRLPDDGKITGSHSYNWGTDNDLTTVYYCKTCQIDAPARTEHCSICNACILQRDHHCIWIDTCIGKYNRRSFMVSLCLCIMTGCYGSHLSLTTVCTPEMYLGWFLWPADCRFVYADLPNAIVYVSACYTYICMSGLLLILCQQILLISQNVLLRELSAATAKGLTRCLCFVIDNRYNKGVMTNWKLFCRKPTRDVSQAYALQLA